MAYQTNILKADLKKWIVLNFLLEKSLFWTETKPRQYFVQIAFLGKVENVAQKRKALATLQINTQN